MMELGLGMFGVPYDYHGKDVKSKLWVFGAFPIEIPSVVWVFYGKCPLTIGEPHTITPVLGRLSTSLDRRLRTDTEMRLSHESVPFFPMP